MKIQSYMLKLTSLKKFTKLWMIFNLFPLTKLLAIYDTERKTEVFIIFQEFKSFLLE